VSGSRASSAGARPRGTKVLVRVDASYDIGTGHVMRVLPLAEVLRERGSEVAFVCRKLPGNLCDLVEERGFEVHRLVRPAGSAPAGGNRTTHGAWLGVDWRADAEQTAGVLAARGRADWLIVDHYALEAQWEKLLRPYSERIMAVDDLADRLHDCDLLLDQNLHTAVHRRYRDLVPQGCRLLLGSKYALLREEFSLARRGLRDRSGGVRRILVFFGGVDATNETAKALEAIRSLNRRDMSLDVVVGASNVNRDTLKNLCVSMPGARLHVQVENMAELMAGADLAVGAGGINTWERCCMGIPSIVIAVARNQETNAEALAARGAALYLGRSVDVTSRVLAYAVETCCHSPGLMRFLGRRGRVLVDGRGAERVAGFLDSGDLVLRPARAADSESIRQWRNAEETRRYSLSSEPIPPEVHEKWFAAMLADPGRITLIGELDGEPAGVLRFDLEDGTATVSVYLVPGRHGRGLGRRLIEAGSGWLQQNRPEVHSLRAEILDANLASKKAFGAAGFRRCRAVFGRDL